MRHPCRLLPPLLTGLLLIALGGCGTLDAVEPAEIRADEQPAICDHQWLLESLSIDGREHRSRLLWQKLWRDRPYLTCDKLGYVRGSAGTNPYLGRFALSGDGDISWSQIPVISRMSGARDSSELEQDYLEALPKTEHMEMQGDSLILESNSGETRLKFKRAEEPVR
ncbi:META domain-containing protein [Microbulbifer sp. SAOS-129_SWC]|uniref:META domain-containing protein n=1 Tax=Microbulbifer sp. SAOS-129_SWC TaxID=3145235 RepID=UPI003217DAB3